VSSSAHLKVISAFFGNPSSLEIEVALHLGTMVAMLIYFRKSIAEMVAFVFGLLNIRNWSYCKYDESGQLLGSLIVATLPAVIVGYLVHQHVSQLDNFLIMGSSSIIFGAILYFADKTLEKRQVKISLGKSLIIGLAQALAFIPGASRLGLCITAARLLGHGRIDSTKFAFLLSIPTVAGAVLLTFYKVLKDGSAVDGMLIGKLVLITSALSLVSINVILNFLKRHSFSNLMIYRICFGTALIVMYFFKDYLFLL